MVIRLQRTPSRAYMQSAFKTQSEQACFISLQSAFHCTEVQYHIRLMLMAALNMAIAVAASVMTDSQYLTTDLKMQYSSDLRKKYSIK